MTPFSLDERCLVGYEYGSRLTDLMLNMALAENSASIAIVDPLL